MPKPRLLITGATGFIGYEVPRLLSEGGYRPRLMEPSPVPVDTVQIFDAEFVQGDLTDRQSLKRAVKGMDGVIHLGAKATFESYKALKQTNLDRSLALMEVALEEGVKTFVFSSSILVYANVRTVVGPDTPAVPIIDYGRIKLETECSLSVETLRRVRLYSCECPSFIARNPCRNVCIPRIDIKLFFKADMFKYRQRRIHKNTPFLFRFIFRFQSICRFLNKVLLNNT